MSRLHTIGGGLGVAALLLASACESSRFGHLELYRTGGSYGAEISHEILVPEGGVILFEAFPRADPSSPEYIGLERLDLRPANPEVAFVSRAILSDTWVVGGMGVGSTQLHVEVDGDVVDTIPVEIFEGSEEEAP
jgi:hypothetical protein